MSEAAEAGRAAGAAVLFRVCGDNKIILFYYLHFALFTVAKMRTAHKSFVTKLCLKETKAGKGAQRLNFLLK